MNSDRCQNDRWVITADLSIQTIVTPGMVALLKNTNQGGMKLQLLKNTNVEGTELKLGGNRKVFLLQHFKL